MGLPGSPSQPNILVQVVEFIIILGEPHYKRTQTDKTKNVFLCQVMVNSGTQRTQQNVYFSESRRKKAVNY